MNVQIQTSQNVEIEYEIAGLGDRIGAAAIDLLIIVGYGIAVFVVYTNFLIRTLGEDGTTVFIVLAALPWFFYDLLCEVAMDGQSFGKKAVKIKVARLDGSQPTFGNYLMRWMVGILEFKLTSGVVAAVAILFNGKGQRLGDLAAGTTVVRMRPTAALRDTIFARLEDDYVPTYADVVRLNDRDVGVIKEVLESREQRENPVIVRALTQRVQAVIGVQDDMPPIKFLRTVVKDYNHITSQM